MTDHSNLGVYAERAARVRFRLKADMTMSNPDVRFTFD